MLIYCNVVRLRYLGVDDGKESKELHELLTQKKLLRIPFFDHESVSLSFREKLLLN
ncbi:hypothetical protein JCM12298_16340 [Desulfothermus naphthae]